MEIATVPGMDLESCNSFLVRCIDESQLAAVAAAGHLVTQPGSVILQVHFHQYRY
jgi:hypothetical protein